MARYWCLCLKYAPLCGSGRCPVDPAKCAAAYVAVLTERGSLVRENFYVFAKRELPEAFYNAFARAASRLFSRLAVDGYMPYEELVIEAVLRFLGRAPGRKVYPLPG